MFIVYKSIILGTIYYTPNYAENKPTGVAISLSLIQQYILLGRAVYQLDHYIALVLFLYLSSCILFYLLKLAFA